jgi:RNA 2',3'-cyclic 3'-phosphodiesterase
MTETWRCFVAVPLDDATRAALSASVAGWSHEPPADALRWADPDGWHLTLAFLGSVDPSVVVAITQVVREVAAAHQPAEVVTARLGAFPRPSSARVLWHGIADPAGALATLAGELEAALRVPPDEPYRAHITLARARRRPVDLSGWIDHASASAPEGRLHVESVILVRSHLGAGPARYETLGSLPLGGRR